MRFFSYFNPPEPFIQSDFLQSETEQVGYRTTEQIVKSYLQAGVNLLEHRRNEDYDYSDTTTDVIDYPDLDDVDPTRDLDFDEVDAVNIQRAVSQKISDELASVVKKKSSKKQTNDTNSETKSEVSSPDIKG